ncbi:MAG: hypothetical protein AAFX53_14070 [Bacteroidota bacterium]
MNLQKILALSWLCLVFVLSKAQEMPLEYTFGEKYNDRYKYSKLLTIAEDGKGGTLLVRSYYTGIVLRPKGYFLENYDQNLELSSEYNYKLKNVDYVDGYVRNGQVYLLFLEYNQTAGSYEYVVHHSPLEEYNFTKRTLVSIPSEPVDNPLDRNYYNRKFTKGFTTSVLFNDKKSAFAISTHFKKGKMEKHFIHGFDAGLNTLFIQDFSENVEEKNYAFEDVAFSKDLKNAYIVGKAYFRKRRFSAKERRFQYEIVHVGPHGTKAQFFNDAGKFPEALKPIFNDDKLVCVGFYADRKNNRYNGLSYFRIDPRTLDIISKKYNPFSKQFMADKFGREDDTEIKNLVFKNVTINGDGSILFNAEEYFMTTGTQSNTSGGRVKVERFHYNDIVSAKLDANGDVIWTRNINKAEVTQGDGAYVSYSSHVRDGDTYFFISTSAERPQVLPGNRMLFKQGFSRSRNVFAIRLDKKGEISFEKIIDDKEARLPVMVAVPLIDSERHRLLFYAKRGSKKQLLRVQWQSGANGSDSK